ncbi:Cyclase-like protein 2 [Citrus sinensis]|uniref:uncharacterized protein LOC18032589 isoform X2 n=1 Tax=Citrus clementina TaxID=85681 RepID=UPI000CECF93B|nr:uncharacterized protein LOC18032589 isoform X2 [Citrus x clementina]XP_052294935.1 cyclase-like protein 2 isoform X2 [Citrus sinensis]KAH9764044.1 Cyclase-like protein 2 [Citrus sinensis]
MAKTTIIYLFLPLFFFFSLTVAAANTAYPTIPGTEPTNGCIPPVERRPVRREVHGNGRIYDVTHRITNSMPTYVDHVDGVGEFLRLTDSIKNGSLSNLSELRFSVHTGTHIDAPGHVFDHYYDAGFDVDAVDLEVLNAEVLKSLNIAKGVRRVLFRTLNTDRRLMYKTEFDTSYVGFTEDGARWLVENTEIKLVGTDYLPIAAFDDVLKGHYALLESTEIVVVEALKLDDVPAGIYSIHCLPLRVPGAEGAPTRCILIK